MIAVQKLPDLTAAAEPVVRNAEASEGISPSQRDLLCELSYIYLSSGREDKALPLIQLVANCVPGDAGALRVLTYALLVNGRAEEALVAVDRLEVIDDDREARVPLLLLRSHALRLAGRTTEARLCFREFISARSSRPNGGTT